MRSPVLHIVHCIDTEGPLDEDLQATFERLQYIFGISLKPSQQTLVALQKKEIDLGGLEERVAKTFAPELLKYNRNWADISDMLDSALSDDFRRQVIDDFGNGWVYSWHCMDHVSCFDNPRHKDFGYGNIFRFYETKLAETNSVQDEINWHYHPLSLKKDPTHTASSYLNNYNDILQILCRRIIENKWFPVVNRPAFHTERPDSHAFLENWLPFDYANQVLDSEQDQHELTHGRFADWSRAPKTWRGYHPSHDDYQQEGNCKRIIFRILNVGTRHRALNETHFHEAFKEAKESGEAIIAFADHDYRDLREDVNKARQMLSAVRGMYPDVKIKFSGAESAAKEILGYNDKKGPVITLEMSGNRAVIRLKDGEIYGPQPFLAIKTKDGRYFHDNVDVIEPKREWSYIFDDQTMNVDILSKIGVGTAGRYGGYSAAVIEF